MTFTIPLFHCFCLFFHAVVVFNLVSATELTFELADDDIQCFFEEIDKGEKFSLDYQVITGGNYDVDCSIVDPGENILYEESKKQYDHFSHTAEETGVYKLCFSNEFSTFSHKTVYFDLQTGEEPALIPEMHNRVSALTQMESSSVLIHEILKTISESQTHYRLREAIDRIRADEIHEHVLYWSIGETVILFVVSISQVVMLKSFFTDKKPLPGLGS